MLEDASAEGGAPHGPPVAESDQHHDDHAHEGGEDQGGGATKGDESLSEKPEDILNSVQEESKTGSVATAVSNPEIDDSLFEEQPKSEPRPDFAPEQKGPLHAVLLLDSSGSMRVTDPERLRDEGAKLFIEFLKKGDKLGIVEFAESAKVIRPLLEYDSKQAKKVSESISAIGNDGLYTDLLAGIKKAVELLGGGEGNASRTIILLSDGKMDPDPKVGTSEKRINEMLNVHLPELKSKGIRVHTLAFSDQVDRGLLAEIATASDAINWFAPEADTIHESYAELFLAVKKPQLVPLTSKGFRIDPDINEATFYINREGVERIGLVDPEGNEIGPGTSNENVKWFAGKKFDVITIEQPIFGDWKVQGLPSTDSFATVLTDLKLISDWPAKIYEDDKTLLQVRLYDSKKPVVLPKMTGVVRYAFQITPTDRISEPIMREFLKDDGTDGDIQAKDGTFSQYVRLADRGEYRLRVVARGPTFQRQQEIPFRVKPRMVSLSVHAVEVGHQSKGDHEKALTRDYFRVELSPEAMSLKKVKLSLYATNDARKKFELPLRKSEENSLLYEIPAQALPKDGKYTLRATLSAEDKRRRDLNASSRILEYVKVTKELDHGGDESEVFVVDHLEDDHHEPKDEKPSSPIPYILLTGLINGACGGALIFMLKKSQGSVSLDIPDYEPPADVLEAIEQLREKLTETELDVYDPRFDDESIAFLTKEQLEAGSLDDAPPPPAGAQSDSQQSEAEEGAEESGEPEDGGEADEEGSAEGGDEDTAEGDEDQAAEEVTEEGSESEENSEAAEGESSEEGNDEAPEKEEG